MKKTQINFGINRFVKGIYFLTCCLINISIVSSILVSKFLSIEFILYFEKPIIYFGLISSILGILTIGYIGYNFYEDITIFPSKKCKQICDILTPVDSKLRDISYLVLTIGISTILVPIFKIYSNLILPGYISSICMFYGIL